MKHLITEIFRTLRTVKGKQIALLYSATIGATLFGFLISIVLTRILGHQGYGDYKFLEFLFGFATTLLYGGFFISGGRLIAQAQTMDMQQRLIGGLILIGMIMSAVLFIAFFSFSWAEEQIFHNDLGDVIRLFSVILFVFPFRRAMGLILEGNNQIFKLSLFRASFPLMFLIGTFLLSYYIQLSLTAVLTIRYFSLGTIIVAFLLTLDPKFGRIRKSLSLIWRENITLGFQVYLGTLANITATQLCGVLIGFFIHNTAVGYFGLALTAAAPLNLLPDAVSATFFKSFTQSRAIPRRAVYMTVSLSLIALAGFLLIIDKVIIWFYPSEFRAAIPLAYILSVGCTLYGIGSLIYAFLKAHGEGRKIRNISAVVGIANVIGYIILIHLYQVTGAAITWVIVAGVNLILLLYYYSKTKRRLYEESQIA